eukprot:570696-Hanusia_phi.AAC.1
MMSQGVGSLVKFERGETPYLYPTVSQFETGKREVGVTATFSSISALPLASKRGWDDPFQA